MKNLTAFVVKGLFMAIQLLLFTNLHASTYYFSSSSGNDSRNNLQAQTAATPWQSLTKLNSVFSTLHAGDSILFKRDDIFYGSIEAAASGTPAAAIVLAAYGSGKDPVISGLTSISSWSPAGTGIWEASVPEAATMIHSVLVNGVPEAIGRYPNASAANAGYLTIEDAPSSGVITGPQLPGAGNWAGADLVIRKTHWVLDRNTITNVTGKTILYTSETGYAATKNYGYFVQNNPAVLDHACEWCYNKDTHVMDMFFGPSGASGFTVEVSTVEQLISIHDQGYIIFDGLVFKGANQYAFNITRSGNILIKNCSLLYSGNTAVHATQSQYLQLENLVIDYSNNMACDISNTPHLVVKNNTISNTGTIAGSGRGDSGSYEALLLSGDNQQIEGNTIINTGYIPVTFDGNNVSILTNFISHFGFVKDDGGGIYTWNNSQNPPVHQNRTIDKNIVLDATGAPDGTEDNKSAMNGIYIDDNADHVTIKNNSMAGCSLYGLYIHNAHDLILDSNTCFNSQTQVAFIHDNIAATIPIRNISFTNNILFSKTATQTVAHFESIGDDLPGMGAFDYNFYCRPLDEQSPVTASWHSGSGVYDLASWQALFNKDAHSQKTPLTIHPFRVDALTGSNMYSNGSFSSDISNLYVFSASGNAAAAWSSTSPLNGGALKISFSNVPDNTKHASVIIGIGAVTAGHTYLLRYDAAGSANRYIEAYLRQSLSPYRDVSERKLSRVYDAKTSAEILFTASASESNASIGLDIAEQSNPVYIDNLQLYDARVTITNPDDSIRFVYNKTTAPASFALDGQYTDTRKNLFAGSISLPPFSTGILLKSSLALLPVMVSTFQATASKHRVLLQWTMAGAAANTVQQVERSADGINFNKIGERPSLTATVAGNYSFTDEKPAVNNYYRIRFVNDDGSNGYSKILNVRFSLPGSTAEALQVMPNPATNTIQVVLANAPAAPGMLLLKSVSGNTLKSIPVEQTATLINITSLARGNYIISVLINDRVMSKQFTKE